jgi:hypothetical protein
VRRIVHAYHGATAAASERDAVREEVRGVIEHSAAHNSSRLSRRSPARSHRIAAGAKSNAIEAVEGALDSVDDD